MVRVELPYQHPVQARSMQRIERADQQLGGSRRLHCNYDQSFRGWIPLPKIGCELPHGDDVAGQPDASVGKHLQPERRLRIRLGFRFVTGTCGFGPLPFLGLAKIQLVEGDETRFENEKQQQNEDQVGERGELQASRATPRAVIQPNFEPGSVHLNRHDTDRR